MFFYYNIVVNLALKKWNEIFPIECENALNWKLCKLSFCYAKSSSSSNIMLNSELSFCKVVAGKYFTNIFTFTQIWLNIMREINVNKTPAGRGGGPVGRRIVKVIIMWLWIWMWIIIIIWSDWKANNWVVVY